MWSKSKFGIKIKAEGHLETTLAFVKPDGLQRALIGEIIKRIEQTGLRICGLKMMRISTKLAELHYAEHQDKGFYLDLVDFITSSPVVVMAIYGPNAIKRMRDQVMGNTAPIEATAGTIRADLAGSIRMNLIHGSADSEAAKRELSLFFAEGEIHTYSRSIESWIFE